MTLPRAALDYLKARGVSARAATKRRLGFLTAREAEAALQLRRPVLVFPYFTPEGKPLLNFHAPFCRYRILRDEAGAPPAMKFRQPDGTRNHPYFDPARRDWPALLADPRRLLVITEGEVKAMCATEHGLACLAFGGVWSWRTKVNGRSVPLPELDAINWSGRPVELAFDSDAAHKPAVLAALHALALELTRRGAQVVQVILPAAPDGAKVGLDDFLVQHGAAGYAKLERAAVELVLDPTAPLEAARAFLGSAEGTLHFWRDDYYRWAGARYERVESQVIRAEVHSFLEAALERDKQAVTFPYRPNTRRTEDVLHSLRNAATLDVGEPPLWLDGRGSPPPAELLSTSNGLLHLDTRALHPHAPSYFNLRAVTFDFDAKAPPPGRWTKFLDELWSGDAESVTALQEVVGYFLTTDSRQQKIVLLVGPPRSGKGTIAGIVQALVGADNVAWPTLGSLGERFGLQPLIGKSLAIISDARLGGRADQQALAERLLSVSGQDGQQIDRKNQGAWTGRLGVRFLVLSNELPRIADASGALASRFVVLRLKRSFLGREDRGLLHALEAELPGILNWALDGLGRLRKRGYFVQPKSAQEEVELLADLSSPIKAFLRERCEVKPGTQAPCEDVYRAWVRFCAQNGREHPGTVQTFSRDLHAAVPTLQVQRPRVKGGGRVRCFEGMKLLPEEGA